MSWYHSPAFLHLFSVVCLLVTFIFTLAATFGGSWSNIAPEQHSSNKQPAFGFGFGGQGQQGEAMRLTFGLTGYSTTLWNQHLFTSYSSQHSDTFEKLHIIGIIVIIAMNVGLICIASAFGILLAVFPLQYLSGRTPLRRCITMVTSATTCFGASMIIWIIVGMHASSRLSAGAGSGSGSLPFSFVSVQHSFGWCFVLVIINLILCLLAIGALIHSGNVLDEEGYSYTTDWSDFNGHNNLTHTHRSSPAPAPAPARSPYASASSMPLLSSSHGHGHGHVHVISTSKSARNSRNNSYSSAYSESQLQPQPQPQSQLQSQMHAQPYAHAHAVVSIDSYQSQYR